VQSTILQTGEDKHPGGVSRDGRYLLFRTIAISRDLWGLPIDPPATPHSIVATDGDDRSAPFSPNGKWICYVSDVSGRRELYIRPFPEARSVQVSIDGAVDAQWSSGSEVVYAAPDGAMMAASVKIEGTKAGLKNRTACSGCRRRRTRGP
jgi:Tol biopolymer transport system component